MADKATLAGFMLGTPSPPRESSPNPPVEPAAADFPPPIPEGEAGQQQQAAEARATTFRRRRAAEPPVAPTETQPVPPGGNPFDQFDKQPNDDGMEMAERQRLNRQDAFYRNSLPGAARLKLMADLYANPDGPEVPPERKKVHDDLRKEYVGVLADLAAYDEMQPFGNTLEAFVSLQGQLEGTLIDPTNWIGWGAAGRTVSRRVLSAGVQQGAISAAVDPAIQQLNIQTGIRQEWDPIQTAMAFGFGAVLGGGGQAIGEGVGHVFGKLELRRNMRELAEMDSAFANSMIEREMLQPGRSAEPIARPGPEPSVEPPRVEVPAEAPKAPEQPGDVKVAELPPVPGGYVRVWHGGQDPNAKSSTAVSAQPDYAAGYADMHGGDVWYADVPADSPWLVKIEGTDYVQNSVAPEGVKFAKAERVEAPKVAEGEAPAAPKTEAPAGEGSFTIEVPVWGRSTEPLPYDFVDGVREASDRILIENRKARADMIERGEDPPVLKGKDFRAMADAQARLEVFDREVPGGREAMDEWGLTPDEQRMILLDYENRRVAGESPSQTFIRAVDDWVEEGERAALQSARVDSLLWDDILTLERAMAADQEAASRTGRMMEGGKLGNLRIGVGDEVMWPGLSPHRFVDRGNLIEPGATHDIPFPGERTSGPSGDLPSTGAEAPRAPGEVAGSGETPRGGGQTAREAGAARGEGPVSAEDRVQQLMERVRELEANLFRIADSADPTTQQTARRYREELLAADRELKAAQEKLAAEANAPAAPPVPPNVDLAKEPPPPVSLVGVPNSAFQRDTARWLGQSFQTGGTSVRLADIGMHADDILALEKSGLADGGVMSREQFAVYQAEMEARLEAKAAQAREREAKDEAAKSAEKPVGETGVDRAPEAGQGGAAGADAGAGGGNAPGRGNVGGYRNSRGEGVQYHGSGDPDLILDSSHYSSLNYYGQGFYSSDAVDITGGYANSRRAKRYGGQPTLYRVEETRPLKILDGETPIPKDVMEVLKPIAGFDGDPVVDMVVAAEGHKPKNMREFFDAIRDEGTALGFSADTIQEVFDSINYALRQVGYDGMSHTGGLRTGKEPHRVVIYFDPEKDIRLVKEDWEKHRAPAEQPKETFQQQIERLKAERAPAEELVKGALAAENPKLVLEGPDGRMLVLTRGTEDAPYRITSFDKDGPTGHRDYGAGEGMFGTGGMVQEVQTALKQGYTVRQEPAVAPQARAANESVEAPVDVSPEHARDRANLDNWKTSQSTHLLNAYLERPSKPITLVSPFGEKATISRDNKKDLPFGITISSEGRIVKNMRFDKDGLLGDGRKLLEDLMVAGFESPSLAHDGLPARTSATGANVPATYKGQKVTIVESAPLRLREGDSKFSYRIRTADGLEMYVPREDVKVDEVRGLGTSAAHSTFEFYEGMTDKQVERHLRMAATLEAEAAVRERYKEGTATLAELEKAEQLASDARFESTGTRLFRERRPGESKADYEAASAAFRAENPVGGKPELATERTAQGEQTLMPGVEPVTDKARAEAGMNKPLTGGNAALPEGGLFDEGARAQTDLFGMQGENLREKFGFKQDNPAVRGASGVEWLKEKQDAADRGYERRRGIEGATTGWLRDPIEIPTSLIQNLPGARGEKRMPGEAQYDWLMEKVKKNGWQQQDSPILIEVNHRGEAFITEGNTRVRVAADLGLPGVWAEVKWLNGGEMVPGAWSPNSFLKALNDAKPREDVSGLTGNTANRPNLDAAARGEAPAADVDALAQRKGGEGLWNEQQRPAGGVPDRPSSRTRLALQSLQQQVANLAEALGIPIRQGRVEIRGALGTFNNRSGVARVKEIADLEVVAHEAAHGIERRIGQPLTDLTNSFTNELARLDYDQTKMRVNEGFAEWVRILIGDPDRARQLAPGFYSAFNLFLERRAPDILSAIEGATNAYRAYNTASSVDVIRAGRRSVSENSMWDTTMKRIQDEGFPAVVLSMFQQAPKHMMSLFQAGYRALLDDKAPVARSVRELARSIAAQEGQLLDLKAADNPEILMRLLERSQQAATRDMIDGVYGYQSIVHGQFSLANALAEATGQPSVWGRWNKERAELFSSYLIARRAEYLWRRFEAGDLPNPPTAFSREDAMAAIRDLEQQFPPFRTAAEKVHGYSRDLLKKQFDGGIISRDLYDELLTHDFYVPFRRDMSDTPTVGTGSPAAMSPGDVQTVSRQRGSSRDIKDPIESLMQQTFLVNRVIRHNDVVRALASLAERAGPAGGRFLENLPAHEARKYIVNLEDLIESKAREIGMDSAEAKAFIQTMGDLSKEDPVMGSFFKMQQTATRGEPIVFYREGGELRAARIMSGKEGHALYETLMAAPPAVADVFKNVIGMGASVLRYGITSEPTFILSNYIRDQFAAAILRPDYVPIWSGMKGLIEEGAQGQSAKMYGLAGGVSGGAAVGPVERAVSLEIDALAKDGFLVNRLTSIKGLMELASFTEAGTRNSIFAKVYAQKIRQGLSEYEAMIEAAFQAQDLLDFGRHGSHTMAIRNMVPFLNATMQGLDKASRTMIEPVLRAISGGNAMVQDTAEFRNALLAWTKAGALGSAVGAMWAAVNWDKDSYRNASPQLKGTHLIVPWGNQIIVVPKPFELGLGFTAGEYAYQQMMQNDPRAARMFAEAAWEVMTPHGGLPVITPAIELSLGKSLYTGRDIVPDTLKGLPPEMQYTDRTSELSKWLGKQLGVSPLKVEYGIGANFGTWGRNVAALTQGLDEDAPAAQFADAAFFRRFIKDPTRSSDVTVRFWDFMSKSTGKFNQANAAYDALVKGFKDQEARDLVAKLPASQKSYVILKSAADEDGRPAFKPDEKRLHPLTRAYDAVTLLNGVRSELASNTFAAWESRQPQKMSPEMRRDLLENIRQLSQAEMYNGLIVAKEPGYERQPMVSPDDIMVRIRHISPAVADEIATRYAANKVYRIDSVAKFWPRAERELVRFGSRADLSEVAYDVRSEGYAFEGDKARKPQKRRVEIPGVR